VLGRCSDLFRGLQEEQQAVEADTTTKPVEVETVVAESPAKGKKSPAAAKNVLSLLT